MIKEKELLVNIERRNVTRYKDLGYDCNVGESVYIKTEDLSKGCKVRFAALCDWCGKEILNVSMSKYLRAYERNGSYCCKECGEEKRRQNFIKKYGTDRICDFPGVREKAKATNLIKYGTEYHIASEIVQSKSAMTQYQNNSVKSSRQQDLLANIYRGEINYPIHQYNADIALLLDKIVIEYNGGGHYLPVKLGDKTAAELEKRDSLRRKNLQKYGWSIITIVSMVDWLPVTDVLVSMLNFSKQYFHDNPTQSWITFDIDKSIYINAIYPDGVPYDYGELHQLRAISSSDIYEQQLIKPDVSQFGDER